MTRHFKLGNSRIPLGLPDISRGKGKERTTLSFRSSNLDQGKLLEASEFIQHGLKHGADVYEASTIPGKGKRTRTIKNGLKVHQITIQPKGERGWMARGTFRTNFDWLLFYDMDHLLTLPLPFSTINPLEEAYQKLRKLMDQDRAFVWKTISGKPKAAFWMQGRKTDEECRVFLNEIRVEIFGDDPTCVPGLEATDMFQSFVASMQTVEEMNAFFEEVEFNKAMQADRRREEGRTEELEGLYDLSWGACAPSQIEDEIEEVSDLPGIACAPSQSIPDPFEASYDGFDEMLAQINAEILATNFSGKYPDVELPRSLSGRQRTATNDLVLRFILSMPHRLLRDGVDIPCTLIQKEFCRLGLAKMRFVDGSKLHCATASKVIRGLVKRGVIGYAEPDETKRYVVNQRATTYVALHPDLIALATKLAAETKGGCFANRTALEAAARYKAVTGEAVEDIPLDGCSHYTVAKLRNYCPSLEVFTELAMMIPGFSSKPDRVKRLESQWAAHVKNGRRKSTALVTERELIVA